MSNKPNFYSLPQFHQAGLQYSPEFSNTINASSSEKILFFKQKKAEGYELFKNNDFHSALEKYHQSLVVFKWIENKNPTWNTRQINDSDLIFRSQPLTEEIRPHLITAYLNIAICSLKLEQWKEAELACDEVLKIDERSVKALYRKAQAISSPITAGPKEYKKSIKYLKQALLIDPKNPEIKQRLTEIKQISLESPNNESKKIMKNLGPSPFNNSIKELDELIVKWEFMVEHMSGNHGEVKKFQKNLEKIKQYKAQLKNSLAGLTDRDLTKFKTNRFGIDISDFITCSEFKEAEKKGAEVLRSYPIDDRQTWEGWYYILLFFAIFMALFSYNLESKGIFN